MTPLHRFLRRYLSAKNAEIVLIAVYVAMLLAVFAFSSADPANNIYINLVSQ